MAKPALGLVVCLALATTCAEAAPGFGSSSWTSKTSTASKSASKSAISERDETRFWAWLQGLLRTEAGAKASASDATPVGQNAEPAGERTVTGASASPARRTGDRADDKDEARQKTGPEPLPLAF